MRLKPQITLSQLDQRNKVGFVKKDTKFRMPYFYTSACWIKFHIVRFKKKILLRFSKMTTQMRQTYLVALKFTLDKKDLKMSKKFEEFENFVSFVAFCYGTL